MSLLACGSLENDGLLHRHVRDKLDGDLYHLHCPEDLMSLQQHARSLGSEHYASTTRPQGALKEDGKFKRP